VCIHSGHSRVARSKMKCCGPAIRVTMLVLGLVEGTAGVMVDRIGLRSLKDKPLAITASLAMPARLGENELR